MERTEQDHIGEVNLPADALYGIHAMRAVRNFPESTPFHPEWYAAMGTVKRACYATCLKFADALAKNHPEKSFGFLLPGNSILESLLDAALEVEMGMHRGQFIVPAVSGGAGTSINMNINEIITNLALLNSGRNPGDYSYIHPIEHANIFQSTNDVVPTALRVAVLRLLNDLEGRINTLRSAIEKLEKENRHALRIAYTQMQEAVPSSFGNLFGAYNDALTRDWWRVSKCFERIKTVNLGGSAIGSGLAVPRFFIREVVQILQDLTKLPLSRAENMYDNTSNLDAYVEVHAILKAHAVNIEKMVSDIRLLSADIAAVHTMTIPACQTGSSIMPGKVNPVIAEFAISAAHKVYANDSLITGLCSMGCLELNAYLPLIGHALLDSLKLLIAIDGSLLENLFSGIAIDVNRSYRQLLCSPSITTALLPFLGYQVAEKISGTMKKEGIDIFEANAKLCFMANEKLEQLLSPENLLRRGFSIDELI